MRIREFIISWLVRVKNRNVVRIVRICVSLVLKKVNAEQSPFSLEMSSIDWEGSNLVRAIQVWPGLVKMGSTYGHTTVCVCVK